MDDATITRRTALAGAAALAATTLATAAHAQSPATPAAGPTTAAGTVFEDDGTGTRTDATPGIPGVLVSNGVDVAVTDSAGRWSLPVSPGQSLFVVKPRDRALPIDPATGLPRFAVLHMPDGTPDALGFRFPGVAPTGPLPASIDFPLRRSPEPDSFKAILFTDPQPESQAELGFVRDDVVAPLDPAGAAFGITTGDLMFDDLAYYGRYNRIVATLGLPWFSCPGNHDMNFEAPDNTRSKDTWKRVFGARDMAFQYGPATFVLLDNVVYKGTDPAKPDGFGGYVGGFADSQLAFVRNILAHVPRDGLVVFCFHIPLRTLAGTEPGTAVANPRPFLEAISTHPRSISFSGHTHTQEHWYFGPAEGFSPGTHHHQVLAAVSGSWWSGPFDERGIPVALGTDGAPNGHHVLAIDGTTHTTTLVPARDPNRSMLRLVLDTQFHAAGPEVIREYMPGALLSGTVPAEAAGAARVLANFFEGGPRSKLEMAVGPSPFAPMAKVERVDPFVEEVYARGAATKKPWVRPGRSSHLWTAALPPGLPRGTHRVRVRATDEFGRPHEGSMVIEVT